MTHMPPPGASWWQALPYRLDPYLFEIGSFRVGWYGLMYVAAFATVYFAARRRIRREGAPYTEEFLQDWLVMAAFGLIIGARLGYVLFYNLGYFAAHPLEIVLPVAFTGKGMVYTGISGMSYHGGLAGVLLASWWSLRKQKVRFHEFGDFIIPAVPLAYTFGRIGNFINGELWGRATDVAWGMYFPLDYSGRLRHPSQLYEALFEGIGLFVFLGVLRKRRFAPGSMLGFYLMGYGAVRFVIEFFREPDAQLGFVFMGMSMGQMLCSAMVLAGVLVILIARASARK